jgi:23S rRNA (cytidine1920-2'-O)/16S rRNA (cytidine1409-2'-O)-methyltransferase
VRRGLAPSRERAQRDIDRGRVVVEGRVADKASRRVDATTLIELVGDAPRFVGRGGDKLDAALDHFGIDVTGRRCLDAGASTGGFTDSLLQRGAAHIVAVDVGHGQLHDSLRTHRRVTNVERTNIRDVTTDDVGGPFEVVVADLSFISLTTVASTLLDLTAPTGDVVVLIKPQFEVGPAVVSKGGGVVRDERARLAAVDHVRVAFVGQDAAVLGVMVSPLTGMSGNIEYLAHVRRRA